MSDMSGYEITQRHFERLANTCRTPILSAKAADRLAALAAHHDGATAAALLAGSRAMRARRDLLMGGKDAFAEQERSRHMAGLWGARMQAEFNLFLGCLPSLDV